MLQETTWPLARRLISACLGPRTGASLLITLAAATTSLQASDRPYETQKATTIQEGQLDLDLALGYREQPRDFGVRDREDQLDLPRIRLTFGLGSRVEAQLSGVAVTRATSLGVDDAQTGAGDWRLATKIRLLDHPRSPRRRPALGLLWEVKLPNASNERFGSDETDFFFFVLLSNRFGAHGRLDLNLGGAILGNPDELAAQNDVAILRAAWRRELGSRAELGLEAEIRDGFESNDSPSYLRAALTRRWGRWSGYALVGAGLDDDADDWQASIGVRRRFQRAGE